MRLLAELARARTLTDAVFSRIDEKAFLERPIPERHRFLFYLGHLEAFDWNLLGRSLLGRPALEPSLDRLFATGIDPDPGALPDDAPSDWPARDRIESYVRRIRAALDAEGQALAGLDPDALSIAIEHRLHHAETLSSMLKALPLERKRGEPAPLDDRSPAPVPRSALIPAGRATLGRTVGAGSGFGWDNESPAHTVEVPAFTIDVHNVSNGQFLVFVRSGGYRNRSLWSDEDRDWLEAGGRMAPQYWQRRGRRWWLCTAWDWRPLPLAWPVQVSHAEASAYARWKQRALPSEAQYQRAACGTPEGVEREQPWGGGPPGPEHGNFGGTRWDPVAIGSYPGSASAFGVEDLVGNGWEWTSSVFAPWPGFEPLALYPGYSQPFFDGQHMVLKGAGPRTDRQLVRRSLRNWYRTRYPWPAASFRLVSPGA